MLRQPKVSLIVPMRNEAGHIERCLSSLFAQDYGVENLDIWVLDGQSTDESREIVEEKFRGHDNCHLAANPEIFQARGFNLGIEKATGQVIGLVSAHSELAPDYVSKAVETLQRTGADLVGGPMRANSHGIVGRAVALATSSKFGVGGARFHYTDQEEEVDTVYMGVCWKKMYERIGGFDTEMVCNEDDELSYRLLKHGGRIICNPAIRSRYWNRSSLSSLWCQYSRYGYWKVRVMQKHFDQMRIRHFVPVLFVASLLGSGLLAGFHPAGGVLLVSQLSVYLAANLLASITIAYKGGFLYLPLLPVVFGTLHLSYGLGFLKGLVDFLLPRALAPAARSSTAT